VTDRDVMEYDVVVVGAGPAGLATAIRTKELAPERSVCVLEKASAVGAHLVSGCVLEPEPLDALLPGWRDNPLDICVPATRDEFRYLTKSGSVRLPTPPPMRRIPGSRRVPRVCRRVGDRRGRWPRCRRAHR
jgi:electron-transferring-flavoprotein dehydrogenase